MKHLIFVGALALLVGCGKSGNYTDEKIAQQVTCVNNLKQIGLGFYLWSGDHRDKNPFEVSTNAGGVMALVTEKDGMRQNGYLIFQCMSCLLYTSPSPRDRQKSRMPSSA